MTTIEHDGGTSNGSDHRRESGIAYTAIEKIIPVPPTETVKAVLDHTAQQPSDRSGTTKRCLLVTSFLLLILTFFSPLDRSESNEIGSVLPSYHPGSPASSMSSSHLEDGDDIAVTTIIPRINEADPVESKEIRYGLPYYHPGSPASWISSQSEVDEDAAKAAKVIRIEETPNNGTRYYYLHIPKAGGYTMDRMISRHGAAVKQLGVGRRLNLKDFDKWVRNYPEYRVFMTEMGFNVYQPPHSLVMFRDPVAHVVSQYFHCKESKDHHRRDRHKAMPDTLHDWLQGWQTIREQEPGIERNMTNLKSHWEDLHFKCFVPVNFQSWLTGFPESKFDLLNRFDAVGIMEDLEKSHCVFTVAILKEIPQTCNCSDVQRENDERSPFIQIDHGVQHHGSSYELSEDERALIQNFTILDQKLYQQATELFEENVRYIEREYNVTLCGNNMY